jgi:hypothetical protein
MVKSGFEKNNKIGIKNQEVKYLVWRKLYIE